MPILFTPGQVVPVADFTALGQQHGGDKSQQARPPTAAEEAAAKAAARDAAPLGDDEVPDPQDPRTWYIKYETNPIHRYHFADGSYVEARTAPNGTDYQIVEYHPSPSYTQAAAKATANDPAQQTPAQQNDAALIAQRQKNAALPPEQDPRYETDQERAARADATIKAQGAAAETQRKEAEAAAEKNKPQLLPSTVNTTSPRQGVWNPATQTVDWTANPNYQNPNPQPISIPGNPRIIHWDDGPGKPIRTEKNPGYIKPSKIMAHPSDPNRMINVTEDDEGNPVILPVDDKTVIKPADLPVLQTQYGQIAQGLGALAQDLNSRYARGEITEKQKNDAFTAAHQQAQTQVAEINSILETSKSIWSGELTQRGQSLNETQSRRGFAQNIFDRAAATGMGIATSAGPGHGKDIAGGVQALMSMGQRYAEGMGGFRESPEVALPPALQQARGIGLPGFGGAAPGGPGGAPGAAPGPGMGPPPGGLPAPLLRPPPPVTGSVGYPGGGPPTAGEPGGPPLAPGPVWQPAPGGLDPGFSQSPPGGSGLQDPGFSRDPAAIPGMPTDPGFTRGLPGVGGMGAALQGAQGFGGSPVAAGGLGVYDPTQDVQGMLGDGADPTWAEAVRRAAGEATQPGYAWQRFGQPASRFG